MTESSMHEPDPPPPAPPPDEPQPGLVEELRQEVHDLGQKVEEVVEHVPQPVRWTVRKLVAIITLGIVALVVIAVVTALLYFAHRTELVARELTLVLNGALVQRSDVQLQIGNVSGNPFRQVRLLKPRVWFTQGDAPALLEAPWIQVQYSPWQWLHRDRRVIDVVVESPVIRIVRDTDGSLKFPAWRSSGSTSGASSGALDVNLRIHNAAIFVQGPEVPVHGMDLDASASIGTGTKVVVRRLAWTDGPWATHHLDLAGSVLQGDSVKVSLDHLTTDDIALHATAEWRSGEKEPRRLVKGEIARLPWKWLARVTGNSSLDVPGAAEGGFVAVGTRTWDARFDSHVIWKDLDARANGAAHWDRGVLTVKPLQLTSEAGDVDGDLGWSQLGWNVGGAVQRGDPARWGAIGITGWPQGDVSGSFRYVVDTRRKGHSPSQLTAALGASQLAGWHADQGTVRVDFDPTGPDSFVVLAQRRGGTMALRAITTDKGWAGSYAIEGLPLDEWPDGRTSGIQGTLAHGQGTVEGRDGGLYVTGDLDGTGTDWLGMHTAHWRLDGVDGALLPKPQLTARARLANLTFLGLHYDSTASPMTLGDGTLALQDLVASAGDTTITLAGRADWSAGGWRFAMDRARMKSPHFDWVADPPVLLAGDAHGVTFERVTVHDGDAVATFGGHWAAPGGGYDWTARATRLDLARLGLPREVAVSGHTDVLLRVTGRYGDPRWELESQTSRPGRDGHAADSLVLDVGGRASQVEVHRAWAKVAGGTAEGTLAFRDMRRAWPDSLSGEGILGWLATAAHWDGSLRGQGMALEDVRRLNPAAKDWGGTAGGQVTIGGSPAKPVLDASVTVDKMSWQAIQTETVHADFAVQDGRLEVAKLRMVRGGRESLVSGSMPLQLALGHPPAVPEAPMSWSVDIPNGDLGIVRLLLPQIGFAAGRYELHAQVRGTPRHPDLTGALTIADGKLRMAGREELFEDVTAKVRLDEAKITVDTLTARQGTRGRVHGNGVIELANGGLKNYEFHLDGTELQAMETGLYAALFDGSFVITDGPAIHGQRVPFVSGNARIRRAVILYDFANVNENAQASATATPLYWTYRIHLSAVNNVHWTPPDGDIEFNVDLDVEQRPDALLMYGEMDALRGNYYFLSNRFSVNGGASAFTTEGLVDHVTLTFDNVSGVNPTIDAVATTTVPDPDTTGTAHASSQAKISVKITGRANEPQIAFASDRPDHPNDEWDQATMLQQITLTRVLSDARGVPLGDPLDNYISRAINRTFSTEMSRAFRGYINEWQIDRDRGGLFAGEGGVILGVGSQVTPWLALRYRQRLPGLERSTTTTPGTTDLLLERDIEAEYRLSRFIYLTTEMTQRRPGTATTTTNPPDFNVNLKARWEY